MVGFTYDAANRPTSLTLPNSVVVSYGYDAASQLTSLTYSLGAMTLGSLTYSYDASGRPTTVGGSWARTGLPAALASASYDAANQILTRASVSFTHDANGNLTNDGSRTYTWNARDQLSAVSGSGSATMAYDATGRRRAKTTGSTTTTYLYDGVNPVQEQVGSSASADLLTGLSVDETFLRTDGSGTRGLLADALGSTLALTDGSGAVVTEYTFDPFGATSASGTSSANPLQFTGRENDGTGLYELRARYYSPSLGRFISEDPLGESGGLNLFGYAENAPLSLTDPFGLKPAPCFGCAPSQDGGGNGGPDGRGPDVGGGAPGPGGNGGRCGAICQLSRGVTQRAGAMTRPKSYLQLAGISVAGGALGVAAVEAVAGAEVVALGELTEVTFGHGARHLAGTGLNQTAVEAVIRAEVQSIAESASTTGEFWGHIQASGQTIQYKAFTLPNGVINVGTYFPIP